jgi:hypothetical protein
MVKAPVLVPTTLATLLISAAVGAQPAPMPTPGKPALPPLIGAVEVTHFAPSTGFIDDAVTADADRLVYVIADAATKAEAHVVTPATGAEQIVDLAAVTLHPISLSLVGSRLFVIGASDDGNQNAALVELGAGKIPAGKVVYKLPPATHVTEIMRDGKPRIAVDHEATTKDGGTSHQVDLYDLATGRRLATGRALELDGSGINKPLQLHVNHWADGWSHAIGIKSGEWNPKEDQRAPDFEATYDLVTGKVAEHHDITDLFEQRRRFQTLADANGQLDFVRTSWDNSGLQVWHAGKPHDLELDQPLASYDLKSLQAIVLPDGGAWLALMIDPVNPDAVARKKADPAYLDVFRAGPDGKAMRVARVLATNQRLRFGLISPTGGRFWLLARNNGFDRGGGLLTIYNLAP